MIQLLLVFSVSLCLRGEDFPPDRATHLGGGEQPGRSPAEPYLSFSISGLPRLAAGRGLLRRRRRLLVVIVA